MNVALDLPLAFMGQETLHGIQMLKYPSYISGWQAEPKVGHK